MHAAGRALVGDLSPKRGRPSSETQILRGRRGGGGPRGSLLGCENADLARTLPSEAQGRAVCEPPWATSTAPFAGKVAQGHRGAPPAGAAELACLPSAASASTPAAAAGARGGRRPMPSVPQGLQRAPHLGTLDGGPEITHRPAEGLFGAGLGAGHGSHLPDHGRAAFVTHVAAEDNREFRQYMEDSAVVVDPFVFGDRGGERWGFYAVYDGHGGRQAVDYCEAKLHEVVMDELRAARARCANRALSDEAVAEALSRSFQRVDDQLRLVGAWRCGCTATVALVNRTASGPRVHVANVGDSRCVAVGSRGCERLSRDHRPTDQAEVKRIEADGGFVSRGRVGGVLGVSRALGDHSLKSAGCSWRPYVVAHDASNDAALIIGSDGLWDAVGDADAGLLVDRKIRERAPERAAKSLVDEAIRRGSMDNITCLVTYLSSPSRM